MRFGGISSCKKINDNFIFLRYLITKKLKTTNKKTTKNDYQKTYCNLYFSLFFEIKFSVTFIKF